MESSLRIVAITNCPAGIAHTYMVAEALEQKARSLGHTIKVETQGSSGVENRLSSEEIAAADYVILATGRGLSGDDRARFAGKKVYEIAISQALKNIDQIFSELPTNSHLFAADSGVKLGKQEVQSGSVMSHLMAGVSAALPFVIGGGILVALANMLVQFGLPYTDMSKGAPSFTWVVESIGYLGFTFMIPIMGAYIASSIADKPAFAPAFLVCYLANDKALLGTQSGAGFLGAVVLGLAIGYFVFWFRKLRCLAAPVWIAEHRQSSMNNLKAAWPAAFDMSLHFITLLREQLDIPLFDSDLIGLYFACALERHQNERQPIILLSDQNAIATINQLAIERDVLHCRVIIARSLSELVAIREEIEPLLIINNSHYLLDDAVNNYITVKNIITAAGIEQIKHFLATAFIRQQPERFFSAPGSFHYSNVRGESWQHITRQICAQLVAQHHITADEAQRIIAREGEGENLIVNRLAIPHCWSEQERRFRGFFITLAQPVEVNNEVINHVLIACAAADARHELKIFSYLASVLCQHPAEVIAGLTGYEAFMELLHKG
ncbi:putative frv operon regulatory protein [Escherichia coli]|nr:putative frv operon regulatory protein [Escherichia coli]WIF91222.1 putative frv operon regulatory protein [Escherichia coli]